MLITNDFKFWHEEREEKLFYFNLGGWKRPGKDGVHNNVNVFNATELYT